MDYEKKYKDALERARNLHKDAIDMGESLRAKQCEIIFPELRESEDERIRKVLVELVKCNERCGYFMINNITTSAMLAWLEEQKTSEEALQYLKENHSPSEVSDFQAAMNIAVAKAYDKGIKDGLEKQGEKPIGISSGHATGKLGEIIKEIEAEPFDKYEGLTDFERTLADVCRGWIGEELGWKDYIIKNSLPLLELAKKQFDEYEQKPTDEEMKELLQTEYEKGRADAIAEMQKSTQETEPFEAEHGKYYYCIKDYFCGGKKQASKGDVIRALRGLPIMGLKDASEYFLPVNSVKCNSVWSEEDEETMGWLCTFLKDYGHEFYEGNEDNVIDWLKSLKQRIGG